MSFGLNSEAQNKKMELSFTTGYVINHWEIGTEYQKFAPGGHIGFNLYTKKAKRFKTDFQLSINLSGRGGKNTSGSFLSVNALYGGRYYFVDPEKSTSIFASALIGGVFINETGDDFTENLIGFGYSAGCFVDINRFIIGASVESYNNFIFKVGYTF